MNAMKPSVVMVGPALDMQGGIASVVHALLDGGLSDVCELKYVSTACKGSLFRKALFYRRSLSEFHRVSGAADVVHVHVSIRGSFRRKREIARRAKSMGKKLILHEHSGEFATVFDEGSDAYRSSVREFFGWADRVIVLSEAWRDYFAERVCGASKIVVMHNAVGIPDASACPISHRDVLFLGRLSALKGPDTLLQAAGMLHARFPDVRFRFAGDGDIDTYKALAKKFGVFDQCDFTGWVNGTEKARLFRESGVFCLPSHHEGMPMSLLEAMSYGVPCIATPVGGIPQVIQDGENGYLIEAGDSASLANRLSLLLSSPEARAELGVSARLTIKRNFNIRDNVELLSEQYEELARC